MDVLERCGLGSVQAAPSATDISLQWALGDMTSTTVEPMEVLKKFKVIAVVGASKNPEKDANTVPDFMKNRGYEIIPVNPTADVIVGNKAYLSLDAIPDELARRVEVVDVFRPSEELPEVARRTVEMKKKTGRPFVF